MLSSRVSDYLPVRREVVELSAFVDRRGLLAIWLKCVQNTESVVVSAFRRVVSNVDGLVV